MFDSFGSALRPVQLGVGTKSGGEVAVHATRRFLSSNLCKPQALLKLDSKMPLIAYAVIDSLQ